MHLIITVNFIVCIWIILNILDECFSPTLLCFSSASAFTASNRWASLGEASVKTKISDRGGLWMRASWKHRCREMSCQSSCYEFTTCLGSSTATKESTSKITWMADRHISGSSPPPRAIRVNMDSLNWFGSSVSYTGPTPARNKTN